MRGEALVYQNPPTPPTNAMEYQAGLSHIAQYNNQGGYSFGETAYGSPGSMVHEGYPYQMRRADNHRESMMGLGIQYDGYGPATEHFYDGQYHSMQSKQGPFSPPTPRSTTDDDSVRRNTRSGGAVATETSTQKNAQSPAQKAAPRTLKTPRVRKKKAKAEKAKTPDLPAPLSILTKSLAHVPVRNMEEWVNRSTEVRLKETEMRKGYITRPMNSFMLYRSAYAERTKSWCLQNNHQIVSSVAGVSWPKEPTEIRELYNEYAKIERINHQNAHPKYKFSPAKTVAIPRKRKEDWPEGEPSDLDDTEWAPSSGRSHAKQKRRKDRSTSRAEDSMATTDLFDLRFGPNRNGMIPSSWEMTNEGRPMPVPMPHANLYSQYFQNAHLSQTPMGSNYTDDLRKMDTAAASISFPSDNSLLGLPSGASGDLLQPYQSHSSTPFDERQMDPMLLAYTGAQSDIDPSTLQQGYRMIPSGTGESQYTHNDLDNLLELEGQHEEYRSNSWQSDPTLATLETDSEFEQWMGDPNQ